ncbi:MAG: hypothetical protein HN576_13285 [Bacteriovoracaceae bacterium]|jgi:hypothetical protein|nr:hypothetical protein [Bacteriovoracaceae bacterium]
MEADKKFKSPKSFIKNINYKRKLEKKYKNNILKRFKITKKSLDEISLEGVVQKWPMD